MTVTWRRVLVLTVWLTLVAIAGLLATRARYTADLSAFLPTAPTPAQQFLVEQLRDGLASRLILIDIEGADAARRAQLSQDVAMRLRSLPAFRSVTNGEAGSLERDRDFIFQHRYLLSDLTTAEHFTAAGLQSALEDGVDLLASPMGMLAQDLFTHDPGAETLHVMEQLGQGATAPRSSNGVWVSRDGNRALLVAETRASGSDSEAQSRAVATIQAAFKAATAAAPVGAQVTDANLRMTGPGVFAAEARSTIEHEAVRLSLLSAGLIATLLFIIYRSFTLLLLGLLPVASGALAGVAAVALGFGVVHGVTLGFGITLIGEAVDYSIYLFMQARRDVADGAGYSEWSRTLWPTIRLGMLTSVCGFASLLPSAFPGLAQLGLYSIAGLVAAALVTRYVLPQLLPLQVSLAGFLPLGRALARVVVALRAGRMLLWLLPLVAGYVLVSHNGRLWNRELAALSPVPGSELRLDGELRAEVGAPDVSTLIVLAGADEQSVLSAAENLGGTLDGLVGDGAIAGYQSPARFLPSGATQQRRRAALPSADDLRRRLATVADTLSLRVEKLAPFIADVDAARNAAPLTRADLAGTSLQAGIDALLIRQGDRWHALLPLQAPHAGQGAGVIDVGKVERALQAHQSPGVELAVLDLKRDSDALYDGYLSAALRLSLLGFAAIALLLTISLRSVAAAARVIAPLVLAVLAVLSGFMLAGRSMTILHLIGLLLIIAVGSNYALFFEREAPGAGSDAGLRTLASLAIANLTTVIAFGVLSFSSVPVLSALGTTVAPGALLALVFAAMLARAPHAEIHGRAARS